jgi:hypothetical protein
VPHVEITVVAEVGRVERLVDPLAGAHVVLVLEASVAVIAVLTARQGRPYMSGLAFTFIAYAIYDFARFMHFNARRSVLK